MTAFEWALLGDLATSIVDGPFGSNLKTSDYVESGVPVLQGKNITHNRFSWTDIRYISREKAEELKRSKVFVGDHLIIKIGSIGYSAIVDHLAGHDCAIIPANMAKVTPNLRRVDQRYLHRWLVSDHATRYFKRVASKTAQPALSLRKIKELEVPLPPLVEQRRIAVILDKADALRSKRSEAIAKIDHLLRSVFLNMFGDPATNPKAWREGQVGDLLESLTYGSSEKADLKGDVPILRMNNLTYLGEMDLGDLKYISATGAQEKYMVRSGDILFNRTNSKELVGKTVVYTGPTPMAYAGYLIRARTLREHSPEYISAFLNSAYGKSTLRAMCKSIVGMANINARELGAIGIPIPPTDLQARFQHVVCALRQRKQLIIGQRAVLDSLCLSLQQRAFSGKL